MKDRIKTQAQKNNENKKNLTKIINSKSKLRKQKLKTFNFTIKIIRLKVGTRYFCQKRNGEAGTGT
jgi:hypothetical protein